MVPSRTVCATAGRRMSLPQLPRGRRAAPYARVGHTMQGTFVIDAQENAPTAKQAARNTPFVSPSFVRLYVRSASKRNMRRTTLSPRSWDRCLVGPRIRAVGVMLPPRWVLIIIFPIISLLFKIHILVSLTFPILRKGK